jgi:Subtilase family/Fervidolysin N-terminal prodomain
MRFLTRTGFAVVLIWLCLAASHAFAGTTNILVWNRATDRVTADVHDWPLLGLLEAIAGGTGWQLFMEPDDSFKSSVKFSDRPSGEALRLLLGDLNYALVPQTNAAQRLYVFRTTLKNATQPVRSAAGTNGVASLKHVPNELIVRVKPGTDIEELARRFGAKITGRLDEQNAYRLEFPDADAADAAKKFLADASGVADVDYNYYFEPPQPTREFAGGSSTATPALQLKPPGDSGRVIVGLIDTAVQPLGGNLDAFLLQQLSVAGQANLDSSSPLHGTSMAETILRSIEGVTKGSTSVQILPVDVYGAAGDTTTWNVALGIAQAVNNGATVLNLSLGGTTGSAMLQDLIAQISARGIPIFAAAGNEPVTTPFYPAAYPQVIAVTGGNQNGISSYANRGSFVDVVAPDASIVAYGNRQWYVVGTSAASAFTAGVAAGLADKNGANWSTIVQTIQHNFPVPGAPK